MGEDTEKTSCNKITKMRTKWLQSSEMSELLAQRTSWNLRFYLALHDQISKNLFYHLICITNLTKLCSFLAFTAKSFTGWMPSRWSTTRKQSHGYWRGINNTYSMLLSHKRIPLNIVNCQNIFSICHHIDQSKDALFCNFKKTCLNMLLRNISTL